MSSPSSDDLAIAELLAKRQSYDRIASALHVSPKRIAQVRRLIEAASIKLDREGKASYAAGYRPGMETRDFSDYAYRAARILGVEDPEEALKVLLAFAVKLNPYILHYKVKTPEDLIEYFESSIRRQREELKACKDQIRQLTTTDETSLARRMGLDDRAFNAHREICSEGFNGTLADFLNQISVLGSWTVKQ
jgi:hypothetical protein